jgi:hypothetical protein
MASEKPWATGPAELLRHALSLLRKDTDSNRRIAMILLDNAVEQAIKTFLSLPRRVTGTTISRKRIAEIGESFPMLLDALEEFAPERVRDLDLGAVEWYHRLRNELYHQGFGLTVEREKVEVYSELAQVIYRSLFGVEIPIDPSVEVERLGKFIELWNRLEKALQVAASYHVIERPSRLRGSMRVLRSADLIQGADAKEIDEFRRIRNQVVHGQSGYKELLTEKRLQRLGGLVKEVEKELALYDDK